MVERDKYYFNSIKVRLEHRVCPRFLHSPLFQFHKGTIRTFRRRFSEHRPPAFQFHKGTIRTD